MYIQTWPYTLQLDRMDRPPLRLMKLLKCDSAERDLAAEGEGEGEGRDLESRACVWLVLCLISHLSSFPPNFSIKEQTRLTLNALFNKINGPLKWATWSHYICVMINETLPPFMPAAITLHNCNCSLSLLLLFPQFVSNIYFITDGALNRLRLRPCQDVLKAFIGMIPFCSSHLSTSFLLLSINVKCYKLNMQKPVIALQRKHFDLFSERP